MRPLDRAAILFINNSPEAAPAGCVLEPDGTVTASGQLGLTKPTAKSAGSTAVFINGLVPVPAGGIGQAWSPYPVAQAALDTADVPLSTTPAALGVVAGDWYLRKSGTGFLAVVPDASGYTTVVPTAGESGFWAEITGSGGTPTAYSWKKKVLDSSFAWVDASPSVTGTANAYPVAGSGSAVAPAVGDPVWMRPSATEDGKYEFQPAGGGGTRKWVRITSGSDASGYAGTRQAQTSPGTWADYPTGTPETFTAGTIRRTPSNTVTGPGGPPDLQAGDVVEIVPSLTQPGYYETRAASLQEIEFTVVTDASFNTSTCVFTKVTSVIKISGRDLKLQVV